MEPETNDINRRKRNETITGLPEPTGTLTDQDVFSQFCEDHLSIKPSLPHPGCRRLGHSQDGQGRPRRLLVHLNSELSATELLASAQRLRHSDDATARSVYVTLTCLRLKHSWHSRDVSDDGRNHTRVPTKLKPVLIPLLHLPQLPHLLFRTVHNRNASCIVT